MDNPHRDLGRLLNRARRAAAFSAAAYDSFEEQALALQIALQAAGDPRGPHMAAPVRKALEAYAALPHSTGNEDPPRDALYTMQRSVLAQHKQPPCIVENILRQGEVAIMAGAPKGKKTWLALDLALACLYGGSWLGQFLCHGCRVLYVDMECHPGTVEFRLQSLHQHHRWARQTFPDDRFHLAALRTQGTYRDYVCAIEQLTNTIWDVEADIVIVDTISAFLPLKDENANAEVNHAMGGIMAAASQTEAGLFVIHHTPKGGNSRDVTDAAAGAGAFTRRPDTVISVTTETLPPPTETGGDETTNHYIDFRFRSHAPLDRHRIDWLDVGNGKPMHVIPQAVHDPRLYQAKAKKAKK